MLKAFGIKAFVPEELWLKIYQQTTYISVQLGFIFEPVWFGFFGHIARPVGFISPTRDQTQALHSGNTES